MRFSKRRWTISIPAKATRGDVVVGAHFLVGRDELVGHVGVEGPLEDVEVELGLRANEVERAQAPEVLLLLEVEQDFGDFEVGLSVDRVDDAVDLVLALLQLYREGQRERVGHFLLVVRGLVRARA